jgi:leader peptidase (prepilin peptidase) / N-methyltransferase
MLASTTQAALLLGLLGLLVGSFINVVIHRLPRMMEQRWAAECAEFLATSEQGAATNAASTTPAEPYNLMLPRSHCPQCGHTIRWYENIPVLSYLALRGACSQCAAPIGLRYPGVELFSALLFAWCGWRWGLTVEGVMWSAFAATLLALACIDWDTTLLPDDLTLPLIWVGLCAAALGLTGTVLADALWGAVAGYLSLWLLYWVFKLLTGKEGMGYGDFKLLAALGAWFGWQGLVPMILMASLTGAVVGLGIKALDQLREGQYIPFGPFLALAGLTAMVFGPGAITSTIGL